MTKTFERFLRSFSDEELAAFARDREQAQPPYWKVMRLALRIEATRRGLSLDDDPAVPSPEHTATPTPRTVTA